MGADGHALFDGHFHSAVDRAGIAGMEATGDVGRGDVIEQRGILAHMPCTEGFTHVAIEVEGSHHCVKCLSTASRIVVISRSRASHSACPRAREISLKRSRSPGLS